MVDGHHSISVSIKNTESFEKFGRLLVQSVQSSLGVAGLKCPGVASLESGSLSGHLSSNLSGSLSVSLSFS